MMDLKINGSVGITIGDDDKTVIFDKRIANELSETKDANGNKIEFVCSTKED